MGGGTEPSVGEVWYTGTLSECHGDAAEAVLTETDKANTSNLIANYNDYSININGTPVTYAGEEGGTIVFTANGEPTALVISTTYPPLTAYVDVACPTDITTVEVTVAKK